MARQIVERYICDQSCGEPAVGTEEFTVLGRVWQKDFCQTHLDEFRAAMAPWIEGANDVARAPRAQVTDAITEVVTEEPVEIPAPRMGLDWWLTPPGASHRTKEKFSEARSVIHQWGRAQMVDGERRFPRLNETFLGKIAKDLGSAWTAEVAFGHVSADEPRPKNKAKRSLKAS